MRRNSLLRPLTARTDLRLAAAFMLLLLATLAVFWPAIHGPFVFDDFPNLRNLTHVAGELDWAHIGEYLASFNGNPGRPLATLTFLIEDSNWPTVPLAFKRDNLLLHLLAGVLVFALARALARRWQRTRDRADLVGLATMALWLLHPMQLSATMLVVQRMNILSTIFVLAGLLGYQACLSRTRWPNALRVVAAGAVLCIAGVLALLCKENGVLLFAYAIALNVTLLRDDIAGLRPAWRRLLHLGVILPIAALAVGAYLNRNEIIAGYEGRDFSLGERLLSQPRILFDYLRQIVLPRIGEQGLFHDGYAASRGWLSPPTTLLSILALSALVIGAVLGRARWPLFALAVFWFLAGHLIESTVIPLELYFEHRNYLPMVGPMFAVACGVAAIDAVNRRLGWALLSLWLVMATTLTALNAKTWGDRGLLATVWAKEHPDSTRAVQMLAAYQYESGDAPAARATLERGLARLPGSEELAMQVVLLDCYSVGIRREEWEQLLQRVARMRYTAIMPELAARFGEQQRSERCGGTLHDGDFMRLANAMIRNPNVSWRGDAMGFIYYEMFRQAAYERNLQQTMDYLDTSYRYRPDPLVPRNQAIYLLTAGLPDDAMRYLAKSEATPQPWIKRHLFDIKALNAPLWQDARELKQYLRQHPPHGTTTPAQPVAH